jgi:hypothetical protein
MLTTNALLLVAGGGASLALGSAPAFAANGPVVFEYGVGDPNVACKDGLCPTGTAPWLRATITDTLDANQITTGVKIKLESLLKRAGEHFQSTSENPNNPVGIAFSFTEPLPVNIIGSCTAAAGSNGCLGDTPQFLVKENDVNLPGDAFKGFDLALFLAPPPQPAATNRFDGSDVITFTLRASGLNTSKFLTTNTGGPYCSAAKVGGLPNDGSTVIGAVCGGGQQKAPAPLPILGASMAFGFSRRLRRRVRGSGDSAQTSIG